MTLGTIRDLSLRVARLGEVGAAPTQRDPEPEPEPGPEQEQEQEPEPPALEGEEELRAFQRSLRSTLDK